MGQMKKGVAYYLMYAFMWVLQKLGYKVSPD
jgi:hypothetical protein